MDRRSFISSAGALLASRSLHAALPMQIKKTASAGEKATHSIRIAPGTFEIGPGIRIETLAYNGQIPGPLLRLREGVPVDIDVTNAGPDQEIVHWHGLAIDSLNDGAMEEGSPMIAAGIFISNSTLLPISGSSSAANSIPFAETSSVTAKYRRSTVVSTISK